MPMTRMLTRITSMITISHMTPLLRSEKEVEVRRDTGDISMMVDVECENDRIDPWAEANISAFLTLVLYRVRKCIWCRPQSEFPSIFSMVRARSPFFTTNSTCLLNVSFESYIIPSHFKCFNGLMIIGTPGSSVCMTTGGASSNLMCQL